MTYTEVQFDAAARDEVLHGATELADAVRVTLGPRSRCVLIQKKWGRPLVCNDGVTIAKEIRPRDPRHALGAQMMREVAERTGDAVGDGTSTATILAHALFAEGLKNITAGASAVDLKRGLDRGLKVAVEALKRLSRPVAGRREKEYVATIAAHNDAAMGRIVAEAEERVGSDGVISVEEARAVETSLEVVEGMKIDHGFVSAYFVTDTEKMRAELEDCAILLTDRKIAVIDDLVPVLEQVTRAGQALLVVADDVEGDALATLVVNRMRGVLKCAAVKSPGFGDRRKDMLRDIAVLTGGHVISEEMGAKLDKVRLPDLGRARRVVVERDSTVIVGGAGKRETIAHRCAEIRKQVEQATSDYDKEKLTERLARLTGGVAVIKVGAPSEAELKNRKEGFEDAISATRAAVAEGIVPGGGLALVKVAAVVAQEEESAAGDERTGVRILRHALEAPARQIAQNSGLDGGLVVERLRQSTGNAGLDASTGTWVDLVDAGIIDPTKVVRTALENAVSVAGTLLLTDATLIEMEEPVPHGAAPGAPPLE